MSGQSRSKRHVASNMPLSKLLKLSYESDIDFLVKRRRRRLQAKTSCHMQMGSLEFADTPYDLGEDLGGKRLDRGFGQCMLRFRSLRRRKCCASGSGTHTGGLHVRDVRINCSCCHLSRYIRPESTLSSKSGNQAFGKDLCGTVTLL